jgi:hydroxymethylpyrimidine/phosphomethylpyrimidine kinase
MARDTRPISVLSIAGSDSGGGAGIQADLKTFAAHGLHGLSAIAALTAQNTQGVSAVHVPPPAFLRAQVDACFADFRDRGSEARHARQRARDQCRRRCARGTRSEVHRARPGDGGEQRRAPARGRRARRAASPAVAAGDAWSPEHPEAELLLGHAIPDGDAAEAALVELLALGAPAVLLKGGHLPGAS